MADTLEITEGSGTVIDTDEVTRNAVTCHQQVVKISLGADGASDCLVDSGQQTMANSVPVVIASDQSFFTPAEVTHLYAAVAFGDLTSSFVAAITDSNAKLQITIDNQTNAAVLVSFDGTNTHEYVSPASAVVLNLGQMGKKETGNISLKHTGSAPTAGSVYVTAKY